MTKVLAAALVAVIAIDKISFDNTLYEPGSKLDGLTPDQAQGLVANGHAKHLTDEVAAANGTTLEAGGAPAEVGAGEEGAGTAAAAAEVKPTAAKPAAAKPAAAKTTAKK